MGDLIARCRAAYERYEFHIVYHAIHNFCVVDMSNFYLDVLKDRLYCEAPDGLLRRSAQSAMYRILDAMVRLLAPILSFTAEEIWAAMPHSAQDDARSVMFNYMAAADPAWVLSEADAARWDILLRVRADVNKALELARAEKKVGKPLDAELTLYVEDAATLEALRELDLCALFIVSDVTLEQGKGGVQGEYMGVEVRASDKPKCARCWCHDDAVAADSGLCPRCAGILGK